MRVLVLFLALILSPVCAAAFEIEERARFGPDPADQVLTVLSTGDAALFAPIIRSFLQERPGVAIDYIVTSSAELMTAVSQEDVVADLALSSATDLQTKLVNDGFALVHRSAATAALPDWARWRSRLFAFTQEPAAILLSRTAFDGLPMPRTRQDLITTLRAHPDRFVGKVGTYDVRISGLGYLFATQDARNSETFWRLAEVMGALGAKLYCCSGDMIDAIDTGDLAVAYNVLGSYARARQDPSSYHILLPEDFTTVMLRTALIPRSSVSPELAGAFVDHLVSQRWQAAPDLSAVFDATDPAADDEALRRIPMGPGLLVFLDPLKKAAFFEAWGSAILQ